MLKVAKFGGTSMANAACIGKVKDIILSDEQIRYVIVSAPGKRESNDIKITDLLYKCFDSVKYGADVDDSFKPIKKRFDEIIRLLGLDLSLDHHYDEIRAELRRGTTIDYIASRGEFLSAIVTANYLGWEFLDAREIIKFDALGRFDAELTNSLAGSILNKKSRVVIPGFYGETPDGKIKTFSRGGSDVTGAIVARAVEADIYENWTDVDGFMKCDPRIVDQPELIDIITYKELRELSYMGANVLHPDSIFPVRKNDIPINIRNTFNPSAKGTFIVPTKKFVNGEYEREHSHITGVAGKKGFLVIRVEKSMMNDEIGFGRRLLNVIEDNGMRFEHIPSGIDTMSIVLDSHRLSEELLNKILGEIQSVCEPDNIHVERNLALIAVVGHGMTKNTGTAGKIFTSLGAAGINVKMIDQGSSELNIIIAREESDYERALQAVYEAFRRKK